MAQMCEQLLAQVLPMLQQPVSESTAALNGLAWMAWSISESTADKVKSKRVQRVWGTMRDCSSRTVLTVLQRLSTVAEKGWSTS